MRRRKKRRQKTTSKVKRSVRSTGSDCCQTHHGNKCNVPKRAQKQKLDYERGHPLRCNRTKINCPPLDRFKNKEETPQFDLIAVPYHLRMNAARVTGLLSAQRFPKARELGRGAFGVAYLVHDCENLSPTEYALKIIDITALSPKMREAAQAEVAVLDRLMHPSIVGYFGSWLEVIKIKTLGGGGYLAAA